MEDVPVFIKIDDYKEVVEIMSLTREKIAQVRGLLSQIGELKTKEDEVIADWARDIEEIESRLDEVDKTLSHEQLR